jgi:diacylglycerol kinase
MNSFQKERQRHHISVKLASEGIKIAWLTQPNFLYHLFFSSVAILLAIILKVSRMEWLILILTITIGLVAEMANTAIESVVDLVTDVWHKDAKVAKDVAAGMVLTFAYGSVIIAAIIFIPHFLELLNISNFKFQISN